MKTRPLIPAPGADCPVTYCLSIIGGKWKPVILFCIQFGVNRFGGMQRAIPGVTKQMLTLQLRELEFDGLVKREVFAEIPPRVEYSLTERGQSILPVIKAMSDWANMDKLSLNI